MPSESSPEAEKTTSDKEKEQPTITFQYFIAGSAGKKKVNVIRRVRFLLYRNPI